MRHCFNNSPNAVRIDVARTFWKKIETNHVRAELRAYACIIRIRDAANLDLNRVVTVGCSHGAVRRRNFAETGHRPVATTNFRQ